ncbi:MAG: hypothetical protein ACLTMR_07585 [Faecalibacillus sp.]
MEYPTTIEKLNAEENNVLYGTLDNGQRIKLIKKQHPGFPELSYYEVIFIMENNNSPYVKERSWILKNKNS